MIVKKKLKKNSHKYDKFCSVADEKIVFLDVWRTFQVIEMNE
jgi:hypothetical protein